MSGFDGLSEKDQAVMKSLFDPTLTISNVSDDGDNYAPDEKETFDDLELDAISSCAKGVAIVETGGDLNAALKFVTEAINTAPSRPGPYNDRAQIYRLLHRDDEAMDDLNKVMELTASRRGRIRAIALCQRALLLRKRGQEDAARDNFSEAIELGSGFARKQLAQLNPYAALCNQMLTQVLRGEKDIKIEIKGEKNVKIEK